MVSETRRRLGTSGARLLSLGLVCLAGSWARGAPAPPTDSADGLIQIGNRTFLPPSPDRTRPLGACPKTGQISFVSADSLVRWGPELTAWFGAPRPTIGVDPHDSAGRQVLAMTAPHPHASSALTLYLKYMPTAGPCEYHFPEEWMAARVYLSRGVEPIPTANAMLEFCQVLGDALDPAITLAISQDDRLLIWGSALSPRLTQTVLPVETWFEVLVHWRAATVDEPGVVEVWVDGERVDDLPADHQDQRGVDKLRLCATNIERDEPCAAYAQWIAWGEVAEHAIYRPGLVLAQNRDVSQDEAAILLHFHPGEHSINWLNVDLDAQVRYVAGDWPLDDQTGVLASAPVRLDPESLYTATTVLGGLAAGTEYSYKVRVFPHGSPADLYEPASVSQVRTLPTQPEVVKFGWVVCHDQGGLGHPYDAYRFLAERGADFVVHLGDYIYNDRGTSDTAPGTTTRGYLLEYLNAADDRFMPDSTQRRGLFMMWDDHEIWDAWDASWQDPNDSTPSPPDPDITRYDLFVRAKHAFNRWFGDGLLNLSVPGSDDADHLDRQYYRSWETARCKFILLDTRSHQSCGTQTMIGADQKAWLFNELASNTKPLVFLLSPSTWGDIVAIFDNWNFGCFSGERREIETYFQNQTSHGSLFILTGDRHVSFVHTRFDESRIICEADACPASMLAWEIDEEVADWDGVLFISVDGADTSLNERARMCGGVEVNELTGEVGISIIDAETGEDLFQHTFVVPLCPEDLTGDGVIGQDDLGQLLGSYLMDAGGDIDGDGDTDQSDLAALLSVYGLDCP